LGTKKIETPSQYRAFTTCLFFGAPRKGRKGGGRREERVNERRKRGVPV